MLIRLLCVGILFAAAAASPEPMSAQKFLTFLIYVVTTTFTPGPNNIMAMSTAGSYGFKRSFRYCLGVFFGFFLLLVLAAAFSTLLSDFIPRVEFVMKLVGAAYILFLAFIIVRDKPHAEGEEEKRRLRPDSVVTGTVMQFVNPKGILFSLVCMSSYVLPHYRDSIFMVLLFAVILAVVALASTVCWALCGSVFERVFSKHKRALNIVMALLLVYCAVALFL